MEMASARKILRKMTWFLVGVLLIIIPFSYTKREKVQRHIQVSETFAPLVHSGEHTRQEHGHTSTLSRLVAPIAMGIIQVGSDAAKSVNQRVPPSANPGSIGRLDSPRKGNGYPAMPRIVSDIVINRGICTQGKRKLTRGLHRLAEYNSLALARYCQKIQKIEIECCM